MAISNHRPIFGKVELEQPHRIPGEAILRLTERAVPNGVERAVDAFTGVKSIDTILRSHRIRAAELLRDEKEQHKYGLTRLYRLITDHDEEIDSLIAELRDHPDVELIMPRYPAYT